jgi:hypothetical protein
MQYATYTTYRSRDSCHEKQNNISGIKQNNISGIKQNNISGIKQNNISGIKQKDFQIYIQKKEDGSLRA